MNPRISSFLSFLLSKTLSKGEFDYGDSLTDSVWFEGWSYQQAPLLLGRNKVESLLELKR